MCVALTHRDTVMLCKTSPGTAKHAERVAFVQYNTKFILLFQFYYLIERCDLTRVLQISKWEKRQGEWKQEKRKSRLRYLIYSFSYNVTPQVLRALVLCHDFLKSTTERVHVVVLEVHDCTSWKLESILYPPVNTFVAKRETRMNEPKCSDKKTL